MSSLSGPIMSIAHRYNDLGVPATLLNMIFCTWKRHYSGLHWTIINDNTVHIPGRSLIGCTSFTCLSKNSRIGVRMKKRGEKAILHDPDIDDRIEILKAFRLFIRCTLPQSWFPGVPAEEAWKCVQKPLTESTAPSSLDKVSDPSPCKKMHC